jgi:hypothetical protein
MSQEARDQALLNFRSGKKSILIATGACVRACVRAGGRVGGMRNVGEGWEGVCQRKPTVQPPATSSAS